MRKIRRSLARDAEAFGVWKMFLPRPFSVDAHYISRSQWGILGYGMEVARRQIGRTSGAEAFQFEMPLWSSYLRHPVGHSPGHK